MGFSSQIIARPIFTLSTMLVCSAGRLDEIAGRGLKIATMTGLEYFQGRAAVIAT